MLGIQSILSFCWQAVQSLVIATSRALFASTGENTMVRRQIGIDQIVFRKAFWVDRQRQVLAEIQESECLIPRHLQDVLNHQLCQLGVRLGSPAIMLIELAQLRKFVKDSALRSIIQDAFVTVQAMMARDSALTYACMMADIDLMLEETSMHFINSPHGRAWLEASRPFMRESSYHQALAKILSYAYAQLGELYTAIELQGTSAPEVVKKLAAPLAQIENFAAWVGQFRFQLKRPIELPVREKLKNWDVASTEHFEVSTKTAVHPMLSTVIQLAKLPLTLVSCYPRLFSGLLVASRTVFIVAQAYRQARVFPQTPFVTMSFYDQILNADDLSSSLDSDEPFSTMDITDVCRPRKFQAEEWGYLTGLQREGWLLRVPNWHTGSGVAVGRLGEIVVVGNSPIYGGHGAGVQIAQFSHDGKLQWAEAFGGAGGESGLSIAIGADGQIVVVGKTRSYGRGSFDALLVSYSAQGSMKWTKTLGRFANDIAEDVVVGPHGEIVLVGKAESNRAHVFDVFLAVFEAEGSLKWVKMLGGPENDSGSAVSIGPQGQIVLVGRTESYGAGSSDVLIAVYTPDGKLQWAQTMGGSESDFGEAVAIGHHGQIYVAGSSRSFGTGNDMLLAEFNSDGDLRWAQTLGQCFSGGIAIGQLGQIVTVGTCRGPGWYDALVAEFSPDGKLQWAKALGGRGLDYGGAVAIGQVGQIVIVGSSNSYHREATDLLVANLSSRSELGGSESEVRFRTVTDYVKSYIIQPPIPQVITPVRDYPDSITNLRPITQEITPILQESNG